MTLTREMFQQQRSRRWGTRNPERMDLPFWLHMVRTGEGAWFAREVFGADYCNDYDAVWCFNRFGVARVALPDGRVVYVGGEHEDFYDEDFCIYNDVVVFGADGVINIYGYPESVFPPTDFHTATLVGDRIIIVGNLGYPEDRDATRTPVFSLDTTTFAIAPLTIQGTPPGWIHDHLGELLPDGHTIRISRGNKLAADLTAPSLDAGTGVYELSLQTMSWRASGESPAPAFEEAEWPSGWAPVGWHERNELTRNLYRLLNFGHPLFPMNSRPIAHGPDDRVLYELLDGTGRVAVVSLSSDFFVREQPPGPIARVFKGFGDWLRQQD